MLLVGEVDWTLIFAILTAVGFGLALIATIAAVRNGRRGHHVSSSLDHARQSAASSDKRLFEILNAIPVALVQTDVQGRFVFANRAAHQLLGRRDVELLGLRFHSATWGITFPDGRPIPPEMLPSARALRGQTVKGFQHLLANPSTRRRMLVSVTAMPITDELGQIIGSTAAVVETEGLTTPEPVVADNVVPFVAPPEDATARRVFEATPEPMLVLSVHGLVREANRAALNLSPEAVMDADFAERFVIEPDRITARQTLRAALSVAAGAAEPLIAEGLDGRRTRWSILPLTDTRGRTDALLLRGAAIEEPEIAPEPEPEHAPQPAAPSPRLDGEARRYEEVGRMTGGLAQDFGGLLAVMNSAMEMLSNQPNDPDKVRRLAGAALGAGRRGEALTRRMAALTAGEAPLPEQAADVGLLLRAIEGRLRQTAGEAVDLMLVVPQTGTPVRVDPVAFEAVAVALVANASEAGARSVSVKLSTDAQGVILAVGDDGHGMDDELRRRAVEPFFTTRPGAAGLGLAQAAAFARANGGELILNSAVDQGSEVMLVLPAAPAD